MKTLSNLYTAGKRAATGLSQYVSAFVMATCLLALAGSSAFAEDTAATIPPLGIDLSASALTLVTYISGLIATVIGIKIALIGVNMAIAWINKVRGR